MDDKELLALIHRTDIETPGVPMVGLLRNEVSTAHYNARMLAIARAVQAAERERCAQLVERVQGWEGVREVAARIRA